MSGPRPELDFSVSFSTGSLTSSPQLLSPHSSPPQQPVQASSFQPIRPMQPAIFAQAPVFPPDIYRYYSLLDLLYLHDFGGEPQN